MDRAQSVLIVSLKGPTLEKKKGGAQEYISLLSKFLIHKGFRVDILCGQERHEGKYLPSEEVIEGAQVIRVNYRISRPMAIYREAKKRHNQYTLVIENMMAYPLFTPLFVDKSRLLALRHHLQGSHVFQLQGVIKGLVGWFLEQVIEPVFYRRVTRVAASSVTKRALQKFWIKPEAEIFVIPPGYAYQAMEDHKTDFPSVFYIGALNTSRKRIDHLLTAFRKVSENLPEAQLIIAGQGPHEKILRDQAEGLPVQFLGFLTDEEKHSWLSRAWVFASPSTKEGFGITWIEANAHGTPVVGYDLGLDTVNEDCAIMVREGDVEALTKAILSILKDPGQRDKMAKAARENAARFSWEYTGEQWISVLEKKISETRA